MTLFELLKKDHREAKAILKKIEETDSEQADERAELFEEVKTALTAHSRSEEQAVYDKVADEAKTHDMITKNYEEHHLMDDLLVKLSAGIPSEDVWLAQITILRETLEHHIKEEEELFEKVEDICDEEELIEMAEDFQELKKEKVKSR